MKISNTLVLSTATLLLIATGCAKKQENVTASGTYNTTGSNESSTIYDTTTTTTTAGTGVNSNTYNYDTTSPTYSEVVPYDNSAVTTSDSSTTYGSPDTTSSSSTYGSGEIIDNYNDSQSSGAFSTNSSGNNDSYSYGGYSSSNTDYSTPPPTTHSSSSRPSYSSSTSSRGTIQLQIAALKDYYAAEEFKKSLSLDPKYSVYIKRGALNKIIITGISSISEANRLKDRRFPGAFIVHDSSISSSTSSSSYGSSSAYGGSSSTTYSDNSSYGSYSSSSSSSRGGSSGVAIQIGAFSSRGKAQSVANANSGRYKAVVKRGKSGRKTIYRVYLTGFSSRSSAKRALASGEVPNGFVTTVH